MVFSTSFFIRVTLTLPTYNKNRVHHSLKIKQYFHSQFNYQFWLFINFLPGQVQICCTLPVPPQFSEFDMPA